MKRILVLTALAATMAVAAVASPAGAGLVLTDLTVAPDIGRPGDAFTVSGGGCERLVTDDASAAGQSIGGRFAPRGAPGPSQNFSVSVAVAFPAPTATTTTPNTNGDWSVGFVVPPGTPPGVYEVVATCMFTDTKTIARGIPVGPIPYESSTYTVIGDPGTPGAPPAAPVPGTPTFTG